MVRDGAHFVYYGKKGFVPSAKVDAANWKTKAYLGMAVRHLDEGCSRHFQCSGAGDSKSRKDVAPQKTGAAGK